MAVHPRGSEHRTPDYPIEPIVPRPMVAAGDERRADRRGGADEALRGGPVGAVDVQRAGVAVPLCPARLAALAGVLRPADGGQPGLVRQGGRADGRALAQGLHAATAGPTRCTPSTPGRPSRTWRSRGPRWAWSSTAWRASTGARRGRRSGCPTITRSRRWSRSAIRATRPMLPPQLRAREAPSGRKPVGEIAREGPFAF